jgi:hypothetical protein
VVAGSSPAGRANDFDGGRSSAGRVPDCDSGCRGFESRRPPHFRNGPLAQLVEQETLNLLVEGSTPSRPTNSTVNTSAYTSSDARRFPMNLPSCQIASRPHEDALPTSPDQVSAQDGSGRTRALRQEKSLLPMAVTDCSDQSRLVNRTLQSSDVRSNHGSRYYPPHRGTSARVTNAAICPYHL